MNSYTMSQPQSTLLKTALFNEHLALGGKMVPFAGYDMPVQYSSGVIQEHLAVRQSVGLFDVSHMGVATIEGSSAREFLNQSLNKPDIIVLCNFVI